MSTHTHTHTHRFKPIHILARMYACHAIHNSHTHTRADCCVYIFSHTASCATPTPHMHLPRLFDRVWPEMWTPVHLYVYLFLTCSTSLVRTSHTASYLGIAAHPMQLRAAHQAALACRHSCTCIRTREQACARIRARSPPGGAASARPRHRREPLPRRGRSPAPRPASPHAWVGYQPSSWEAGLARRGPPPYWEFPC